MITKDFSRWEPNIKVALWGRGKATANKEDCPMDSPSKAQCDNCEMFMGVRFPENIGTVYWGDTFKGCCWAKIESSNLQGEALPTAKQELKL